MIAALLVPPVGLLLSGAASMRLDRLPEWSASAIRAADAQAPPADADAWVLLQATELVYAGDGKVRARQRRVVRVLAERGLDEQMLLIAGLAGKGSKLKRLRAWNARPDGEVEELTRDDMVALDDGQSRLRVVAFQRAMKGSVLAFESVLETEHPMGPVEVLPVMEVRPVLLWSLATRSEKGGVEARLDALHLAPWIPAGVVPSAGSAAFRDVPARPPEESAAPHERNVLPWVQVSFHDASLRSDVPSNASWDALAAWTHSKYATRLSSTRQSPADAGDARGALRAIHGWMAADMVYRQVYLTPERGWIPSDADEVVRRRYGDCKDLATLLMSEVRLAGLQPYPVLARVAEGRIEETEPPSIFAFNHVIVAVRLPSTLGLQAEVETPQGRFLLMDPTARFSPFGSLNDAHAGRRVLVCTEKGGIWITVPESATQSPLRRLKLEGKLLESHRFEGTLEMREEGVLDGLRAAAVEGGVEGLRQACLNLGLPADARCQVKEHADPLRLERTYSVVFALEFGSAVQPGQRGEWTLVLPGVPKPPPSIAAPGRPRALPVWFEDRSSLELEVHLEAPWHVSAVAPEERGETSFRSYEWRMAVRPAAAGSALDFRLSLGLRPSAFDFERREAGVSAWKKDRAAVRRLHDVALALKME
jgi:hypothetical protein